MGGKRSARSANKSGGEKMIKSFSGEFRACTAVGKEVFDACQYNKVKHVQRLTNKSMALGLGRRALRCRVCAERKNGRDNVYAGTRGPPRLFNLVYMCDGEGGVDGYRKRAHSRALACKPRVS